MMGQLAKVAILHSPGKAVIKRCVCVCVYVFEHVCLCVRDNVLFRCTAWEWSKHWEHFVRSLELADNTLHTHTHRQPHH